MELYIETDQFVCFERKKQQKNKRHTKPNRILNVQINSFWTGLESSSLRFVTVAKEKDMKAMKKKHTHTTTTFSMPLCSWCRSVCLWLHTHAHTSKQMGRRVYECSIYCIVLNHFSCAHLDLSLSHSFDSIHVERLFLFFSFWLLFRIHNICSFRASHRAPLLFDFVLSHKHRFSCSIVFVVFWCVRIQVYQLLNATFSYRFRIWKSTHTHHNNEWNNIKRKTYTTQNRNVDCTNAQCFVWCVVFVRAVHIRNA